MLKFNQYGAAVLSNDSNTGMYDMATDVQKYGCAILIQAPLGTDAARYIAI